MTLHDRSMDCWQSIIDNDDDIQSNDLDEEVPNEGIQSLRDMTLGISVAILELGLSIDPQSSVYIQLAQCNS